MELLKDLHPGNPKYYPYVPVAQQKNIKIWFSSDLNDRFCLK